MSRARVVIALVALLSAPPVLADGKGEAPRAEPSRPYAVRYELRLRADNAWADARIVLRQATGQLREMRLDTANLRRLTANGTLEKSEGSVRWNPPERGGELRYQVRLTHARPSSNDGTSYDALVEDSFAVFRGDRAFPVTGTRRVRASEAVAELSIDLPEEWSVVTPYQPDSRGRLAIANPGTRKPRPVGWIMAGKLGTRRDFMGPLEVTVTAPRGSRTERLGLLALLRLTTPALTEALGTPKRYVNVVSAGDPLWLGALAAPNSIFVHADRPLISENGTSTIVHEMVHVLLMGLDTPRDQDWIDEGLAEYLSLRALADANLISPERFDKAIASFQSWGAAAKTLRGAQSKGPVTARAVTLFHEADAEIRRASRNRRKLIDVVRALIDDGKPADLKALRREARAAAGRPVKALETAVPGFD